jgi:hypothetical protein
MEFTKEDVKLMVDDLGFVGYTHDFSGRLVSYEIGTETLTELVNKVYKLGFQSGEMCGIRHE